jgi:alpha-glucoside transport system permease protein
MAAATKTTKPKGQSHLWSDIVVNGILVLIVVLWLIPTVGLLVSSFRTRFDIQTSGWWTIFPHREWVTVAKLPVPEGLDRTGVMLIEGAQGTFEQFREGIETPGGRQLIWVGNRRTGTLEVQEQIWTTNTDFTLDNYKQVLAGRSVEIRRPDGTT